MILIPDYVAGASLVAGWIADALQMKAGQNMFREPNWPANPDRVVCLFENGCTWDVDKGLWLTSLALQVRSARLVEAHAIMRTALQAAFNGFRACPTSARNGVVTLNLQQGPKVSPRDSDNRVYVDATFSLEMDAPFDNGR